MAQAARVGDVSVGTEGAPAVEAGEGSPDVFINGRAAVRSDDASAKSGSGPSFRATGGSRGVFINGIPAMRAGDSTDHAGSTGQLDGGSPDVEFGDLGGGSPKERPHDRSLTIEFTDALGRAIDGVSVDVFCPHEPSKKTTAHGSAHFSALCSSSTVTIRTDLSLGTWDDNASNASTAQSRHVVGSDTGGVQAPGDDGGGSKTIVHVPAPASTQPAHQSVHVARPNGGVSVQVTTPHNWVELVYRAFGHVLPTEQLHLALLGVREASLAGAAKRDTLETEAGWGDLNEVDFTREHKAPAYNDLLFCAYTDKHVKAKQIVEVFECTIDASPGKGPLHLPFLREGHLFHCKPGPFHSNHYPGHDVSLHVFDGTKEPQPVGHVTADAVIALAHSQIGTLEDAGGGNHQKYGVWYGDNGQPWCAMFVSWCMSHCGLPEIHYEGVEDGWNHFVSGAWGTFHSSHDSQGNQTATAEPGDIVFYKWSNKPNDTHTGIVVSDHGSTFSTIEGNTELQDLSNPHNGGVHPRTRTKNYQVYGFGRPRYKKPVTVETSVIRWGGEGKEIDPKYARGETMLHHHYFAEKHGTEKPDPKAARYRRFMHLYRDAKNGARIPYLIVSSHYVKSYAEWVAWVDAHPGHVAGAASVLRSEGLDAPSGLPHLYVPSYMTTTYANGVLKHAHHMHDHHASKKLVGELEAALITVHR